MLFSYLKLQSEVESNDKYVIVNITGSIIIKNVTQEDFSEEFQCGDSPNSTYSITVVSSKCSKMQYNIFTFKN